MELKILNDTQKAQLQEIISFYKYFFICNKCGRVFGSDSLEKKMDKNIKCPLCLVGKVGA